MRRLLPRAAGLLALLVAAGGMATISGTAAAQTATGQITGLVTDAQGGPVAGITVAAARVGSPDILTLATSGADGRYLLDLPPGSYDVAFNSQGQVDERYDSPTFGGPGPGPGAVCTVCGGRAVTVTAGAVTPNIDAALSAAPFPQTGFVRPLSGHVIRVLGGRLTFSIGCHIEPTACRGTARLRYAPSGPTIATIRVLVLPGQIGRLVFKIPAVVQARLARTRRHSLPALVEVSAPPSHTITRFKLVQR